MRVGFKFAQIHGFNHVIQVDADGQHNPDLIKLLLDNSGECEILIGSRFLNKDHSFTTSKTRRVVMRMIAWRVSSLCGTKITDATSGFRLTSGHAIELFAREYPSEYLGDTVESLIIASHAGLRIGEVAVQMNQREFGTPSQNVIKSVIYVARAFLVLSVAGLRKH